MACTCNQGMSNLGTRACDVLFKESTMLFAVPTFAADGTRNKIASGDTLDEAYFIAAINNVDPTKRWYPINGIENVKNVRAAKEVFTTESGNKIPVQDGIRSFEAKLFNWSARMIAKLDSIGCSDVSVFLIDADNTLVGRTDGTDLYPIRLQKNTFQSLFNWATSKNPQDITIMFDFARTEKDEDLRGIKTENMDNVDFSGLSALLDVTVVISGVSATGFTATLKGDVDEYGVDYMIEGFVKADFTLKKVSDSTPIVITSVTETSAGVYLFVVPSTTVPCYLDKATTKYGYELPQSTVPFTV